MQAFSIKNNYITCHTELNLLGIKIKIPNNKLVKSADYSFALKKIKNKYKNKEKIRVAFLVSENEKWNAEELYNLLEKSKEFEPVILVTLLTYVHNGNDKTRKNLQKNYDFFLNTNKKVFKAYDEEKRLYTPLSEFDVDIIFYQQPWGIDDIQDIETTSKYAISCYFHYGLNLFNADKELKPFHKKLFINFVNEDIFNEKLIKKGFENTCVIGFPKLDAYKSISINGTKTNTIIYAPHFSYKKNSLLKIGTFNKTGTKLLDFAKKHPEYNWIFKPHPTLKHELITDKNFGESFAEKYYSEWENIGTTYSQGNYFDIFNNSDLLITDCSAFLLEYMPTGKPIIRLEIRKSVKLNEFGEFVVSGTYRIHKYKDFENTFKNILFENKDTLKQQRKEICYKIIGKESSSEKIIKELKKKLEII